MTTQTLVPVETLQKPRPPQITSLKPNVLEDFQDELQAHIEGEVRFDAGTKAMYAVDASNYRHVPVGVVLPKSKEDVVQIHAICRRFGVPIVSRGGGTGLAGQTCNTAIVIDWSKYMHGVLEINTSQQWARVLAGTVCDDLRHAAMRASHRRLTWGPDPATHNRCCFGGMIGNNSCGSHAQMSGKTDQNIDELEILLYDGTRMLVGWMNDEMMDAAIASGGRVGQIYRDLRTIRNRYEHLIRERYPKIPRRVSGYNLNNLIPDENGRFNIARALVGSEGTLVSVLEAKCRLVDARAERVILLLGYPDLYQAADAVPEINQFNPVALEGMDDYLYEDVQKMGGRHARYLPLFPEGKGWLMAEFGADHKDDAIETAHRVMRALNKKRYPPSMRLYTDETDMQHLWEVRESGLGVTTFVPGEGASWPGWEDSAVAPEKLSGYLRDLRALFNRYGYGPSIYGHFGHGCVHCSVDFDLASEPGIKKWRAFMEDATDLCVRYGGSLSGEHGDGQARAQFLVKMFGPELIQGFREFKAVWDPENKMNPGKIVDPFPFDADLRLGADYHPWDPPTHFKYPDDGGSFAHAALRCVGVGKCRRKDADKPEDDTMCPSYMVTHEERHTTRGRAHHFWEMLHGGVLNEGWRDENVKESLDLCLACKGCKTDCPVNVDMATYKAEFLSHYWEGRLRPRSAYAFGFIDQWARIASRIPGLVNLVTQSPLLAPVAKWLAGMPQQRTIPEFAPETFKEWFSKRRPNGSGKKKSGSDKPSAKRVILWADTFNNYFLPDTARAATAILESGGFDVHVPMQHLCCGRPLYDYGLLDEAKAYLHRIMDTLEPEIEAGVPIVVLEPSCATVFRDELHNLFPEDPLAEKLRKQTFVLSEFLHDHQSDFNLPQIPLKAIVQGHCHHKSVLQFDDEQEVLKRLGLDAKVLASGCCGMAGSFGFEKDKYDISVAIGDRVLLPAVRQADPFTMVIADGFSCREQIQQETHRHGLHLAEVIHLAQKGVPTRADGPHPESKIVAKRRQELSSSRQRAELTLAGLLTGAALVFASLVVSYRNRS